MPNALKETTLSPGIRILVVQGQALMRETLGPLLRAANFQIVGSCASLGEASRMLEQEPVDVVLIDTDLGLEGLLNLVTEAKAAGFKGQFLITAARMGIGMVLRALESGALGILTQHNAPSELVAAVHRLAKGELWLDSETVKRMVAAVRSGEHRVWQGFSLRECAVLKAVLEGLTNREIAVKLQIPNGAVKYVLTKVFEKTGARTRSQLVRTALEKHAQDWL
jgi:DNA-binding NarL/FixJ family response regulator